MMTASVESNTKLVDDAEYEFTVPRKGHVSVVPATPEGDVEHEDDGGLSEKGSPSNRPSKSLTMPPADDKSVNSTRLEDLLCPITPKTSAARRNEEDEMLAELITPNSKHSMFTDTTELTSTPNSRHSSYSHGSSERGSDSDEEKALVKEDKKKKKKKKSKSKKQDKKIKKEKRKEKKGKRKKDEAPMTVSDENLVAELCGYLSGTLSTTHNKESFLRLLSSGDGSSQAESTVSP